MNNPELYRRANDVQRYDAECVIREYAPKMQWLCNGSDSLIDLGTGSGDVLMDFIYPHMPSNFRRLVGSDINPQMMAHAQKHFGHIKGTEFRVFDVATEATLPFDLRGQFEHVTSFYTLMWVQNQRQAMRNIFDLLRPTGGDCLLMFLARHPTYEAYKIISQMEQWSKYMSDVDRFIGPQHYAKDPKAQLSEFVREAGFSDYSVEIQSKVYDFDSLEAFRTSMMAINAFLKRIPSALHEQYMDDLMSIVCKILGFNMNCNDKFPLPYQLAVIYARK